MDLNFCDPAVKFFLDHQKKNCIEILNYTIWWLWVGGFFQVTPSNFPLFVSFNGILSKFSYVEPNPYYRLFFELGVLCYLTYRNWWRCLQSIQIKTYFLFLRAKAVHHYSISIHDGSVIDSFSN